MFSALPVREDMRGFSKIMFKKTDKKKPRKRGSDEKKTWIEKLDKVFSMYIRLRDSRPWRFTQFRCISCGKVKPFEMMDAGHYISRNCMALRYDPSNVWGECARCNRLLGDHLIGYRKNLILRLGQDAIKGSALAESLPNDKKLLLIKRLGTQKVEALEARKWEEKKWSVDELKELYMYYAALVLELKNGM